MIELFPNHYIKLNEETSHFNDFGVGSNDISLKVCEAEIKESPEHRMDTAPVDSIKYILAASRLAPAGGRSASRPP